MPKFGDLQGVAFVDPSITAFLDVEEAFDIEEDCLAVLVFGIKNQYFDAVEHFSVGRAIEYYSYLSVALIQIVKTFLYLTNPTPDWWASYCPWYSLPNSMSIGPAVATMMRQSKRVGSGQSLRTDI